MAIPAKPKPFTGGWPDARKTFGNKPEGMDYTSTNMDMLIAWSG